MTAFMVPFTSFDVPMEIVVIGVITGLIYGLLGVGLTLVYKSSRVINFAHGDMGALPAGLLLLAVLKWNVPYWVAVPGALVAALAIGAGVEFLVIRRLVRAPRLVVLVATIGASQVLFGLNFLIPRDDFVNATYPIPFRASVTIGALRLNTGELSILAVAPLAALGLALFLRRSKIGLGARAAAENVEAARLAGVPARRVSVAVWALAALVSAVAAILLAPTRGIDSTLTSLGPSLMVRALAASMIGGMTSLPQVFAGGIAIGVIELLVSWNYPGGGVVEIVLFAVIIATLLLRRGLGFAARGGEDGGWSLGSAVRPLARAVARHPRVRLARAGGLAAGLAIAAFAPLPMGAGQRVLLSSIALYALMGLSIVVLTGFAGQVSLGQFAFVGLGAAVGGRLFQLGYPAWVGLLYAAVAGVIVALALGMPSLRVRGLFLAVTTLSFALALGSWLPRQDWLVKVVGADSSLSLPRQRWFGVDMQDERNYFWLCLALLVIGCFLVHQLRRSGYGRLLMAVRDNEAAAASLSVSPRRVKLVAFMISGGLASCAGYFYGGLLVNFREAGLFAANTEGFGGAASQSVALLAMVIFGGVTTVTGAILGALWIRGIPYMLGDSFGILSSGIGVLIVLQMVPGGLAALVFQLRDRIAGRLSGLPVDELAPSERALGVGRAPLPPAVASRDVTAVPLRAESITVRFGGLIAVDDVTIEARPGEIVGLVGPNGAGKTTLFDVLSGQVHPRGGRVILQGLDVTSCRPERRASLGLGRTFQEARLFPDLSLAEAFKVALESKERSEPIPALLGLPPARQAERAKDLRADELLDMLGLEPFARRNCAELSTGTRRLSELGCMLAMGSRVLLLDEPTAGIAQREVEAFTPVLREIRDHLDATIVVIDHDIPMITELVDRLYVMSVGRVIAEGDPRILRTDPTVIAAYLGTDERAIQRSGSRSVAPAPRRERPLAAAGKEHR